MGHCNGAIVIFATVLFVAVLLQPSFAVTCTWTGGSGIFTDASNWLDGTVPGPEDDAIIDVGMSDIIVKSLVKVKSLYLGSFLLITRRLEVTTLLTSATSQINFGGDVKTHPSLQIGSNVTFNGTIAVSDFGNIEGNGFTFNFVTMRTASWKDITFNNVIIKMRPDIQLSLCQVHMIRNSVFENPPNVFSQSTINWSSYNSVTVSGWDLRSNSIMIFVQTSGIDITNVVMDDESGFDFYSSQALIHDFTSLKLINLFSFHSNVTFRNINLMKNILPGAERTNWRLQRDATLRFEFSHFEGTGFALSPTMDPTTTIFFSHSTIIFSNQGIWLKGIDVSNLDHPFLQFTDCSLKWPTGTGLALPLHYTLFNNSILTIDESSPFSLQWIFDGRTNLTGNAYHLTFSSWVIFNNNRILPSIDFTPARDRSCVVDLGASYSELKIRNSFRIGAQSEYTVNAGVTFFKSIEGDGAFNIYPDRPANVTIFEKTEPQLNMKLVELNIGSTNVSRLYASQSVIKLRDGATGVHWKAKDVIWKKAAGAASSVAVTPERIELYEPNTLTSDIGISAKTVTVEGTLKWEISSWANVAFIASSDHLVALPGASHPMNFKIVIADNLIYDTTQALVPILGTSPSQQPDNFIFSFVKISGRFSTETPLGDCFTIERIGQNVYGAANRWKSNCTVFAPPPVPTAPLRPVKSPPVAEITAPTKKPNVGLIVGLAVGIPFFIAIVIGAVMLLVWFSSRVPDTTPTKSALEIERDEQKRWYKEYKGKDSYHSFDIQSAALIPK